MILNVLYYSHKAGVNSYTIEEVLFMRYKNISKPIIKSDSLYGTKLSEVDGFLKKVYHVCFIEKKDYKASNNNLAMIKSSLYHSIL